jgi:hypothetical protein
MMFVTWDNCIYDDDWFGEIYLILTIWWKFGVKMEYVSIYWGDIMIVHYYVVSYVWYVASIHAFICLAFGVKMD